MIGEDGLNDRFQMADPFHLVVERHALLAVADLILIEIERKQHNGFCMEKRNNGVFVVLIKNLFRQMKANIPVEPGMIGDPVERTAGRDLTVTFGKLLYANGNAAFCRFNGESLRFPVCQVDGVITVNHNVNLGFF